MYRCSRCLRIFFWLNISEVIQGACSFREELLVLVIRGAWMSRMDLSVEKKETRRSARMEGGLVMSVDALRSLMNLEMLILLMRRYVKEDGGGGGFGVMSR